MNDYLLLMHDDAPAPEGSGAVSWESYLEKLRAAGRFAGGSSIGGGASASKAGPSKAISSHLTGDIRIQAASLDEAMALVEGNPVYEAGGTVEVRELPRDEARRPRSGGSSARSRKRRASGASSN